MELYNVLEDPSERRNVSHEYPDLVRHLLTILQSYNATAAPLRNKPHDPRSDPALHNHTWVPWLAGEEEEEEGMSVEEAVFVSKEVWLAGNELQPQDLDQDAGFAEQGHVVDL